GGPGARDPGHAADPLEARSPEPGRCRLRRRRDAPGRGGGPPQARASQDQEGTRFFARSGDVLCQGIILRYQVIERCRDEFPIRLMCRCLKVSTSGFYDWSKRLPSPRQVDNQRLLRFTRTAVGRWVRAASTRIWPK